MTVALVSSREILEAARREGYAVGAFNANNLEFVQGIVAGALAERAPVIIQASPGAIKYIGLEYIAALGQVAARADIPVVLHLDHGEDVELARRCIAEGFSSVMYDGSRLPFEENVARTAEVVRAAHAARIACEGELGRVPASDRAWTRQELMQLWTDPGEAARFVAATGVDALAVSVGSVHKMLERTAELDVELVRRIKDATGVPLVLHGSSGVAVKSLVEAVKAGIAKVNIATALSVAFVRAVRQAMAARPDEVDPRPLLGPGRNAVAAEVAARIRLLGSSGRA
jgi:fructose-bisphosphate aldolase class II